MHSVIKPTDHSAPAKYSQVFLSDMERRQVSTVSPRPLVLLVDGHLDTVALCALALSATGFDVVPATDGAEALSRARQLHPDIIVTRLPMPHYDAWQFIQDLKQNACDIPVVALSDDLRAPIRKQPDHPGFAAFLATDCLPHELAGALRQLLEKTHVAGGR
jgi:CheY-like chemotaxis protein